MKGIKSKVRQVPKTKVRKTSTCPQCHKIFEPSDVTEDVWSLDGYKRSLAKVMRCPNCHQAIWAEMPNEKTKKRTTKLDLPERYKNFPITIAKSNDPIYKGGLTGYSIHKSPESTNTSPKSSDGDEHKKTNSEKKKLNTHWLDAQKTPEAEKVLRLLKWLDQSKDLK